MVRVWIALVIVLATSPGCKRARGLPRLERRELPGFSLELPVGRDVRTQKLDYAAGEVGVQTDSSLYLAQVRWAPGSKLSPEELRLAMKALEPMMADASPGTLVTTSAADGTGVETMRFELKQGTLLLSQRACGGRNLLIATAGQRSIEPVHHSMVLSLQCKPDPAGEATLAEVAVDLVLDLPGWYAMSRDENQLQLSDGTSFLMIQPMPTSTPERALTALAPMVPEMFGGTVTAQAVGTRMMIAGTLEGSPVVGWGKLVPCPAHKHLVMAIAPDQHQALAIERAVDTARCAGSGEPRQTWSNMPADPAAPAPDAAGAGAPADGSGATPARSPAIAPN